jgi:hypothetical protein
MPSIADAVARIHAAGLPVMFIDTCSLVDVIREPLRPSELAGCVAAAQEVLRLVTTGRCVLVIASFVRGEWLTHAGPEADQLRAAVARLDEDAARYHGFCGMVGITPPFPPPGYRHLPMADGLHDLSRDLRDVAIHLDSDDGCIIRAHGRASTYTPPSRKGGEVKDSTILEECLEVSRRLHAAGFAGRRLFCTSNRKDYCESGSRLFSNLTVEMGAVGMGFATSLPWAVNEMKKP